MREGGGRKESPAATSLVATGLFDRWGEEKRMRGAFAQCQIERERAQFEFANVYRQPLQVDRVRPRR